MKTFERFVLACLLFFLSFVIGCSKKLEVPIKYVSSDGWLILQEKTVITECTVIKDGIEYNCPLYQEESEYQDDKFNCEWYAGSDNKPNIYILKLDSLLLSFYDFKIKVEYYSKNPKPDKLIKSEKFSNDMRVDYYKVPKGKKPIRTLTKGFDIHVLQRPEYLLNNENRKYFRKLETDANYSNQKINKDSNELSESKSIRKEYIALVQLGLLRHNNEDLNKIADLLDKEISQKIMGKTAKQKSDKDILLSSQFIADHIKFLIYILQNANNQLALDILSNTLSKLENYPYGDKNGVDGRSILLSLPEVKAKNGPNVDVQEGIRRSIITALGKMGDTALPILLKVKPRSGFSDVDNGMYFSGSQYSKNQYIRWDGDALANALGTIGDPLAFPYLVKLFNASSAETKGWVITAMGKIRNPKAILFLYKIYFKEGSNEVKILQSLGEIRDDAAINYLVKIDKKMRSDNPVQEFVIEALLNICKSNQNALPLIFDLYDSDKRLFTKLFERMKDKRHSAPLDKATFFLQIGV